MFLGRRIADRRMPGLIGKWLQVGGPSDGQVANGVLVGVVGAPQDARVANLSSLAMFCIAGRMLPIPNYQTFFSIATQFSEEF